MPLCRFGDDEAIGRFSLSQGCIVYPDDREQDLCSHHALRATPLGTFRLIADYTMPGGLRVEQIFDLMFRGSSSPHS